MICDFNGHTRKWRADLDTTSHTRPQAGQEQEATAERSQTTLIEITNNNGNGAGTRQHTAQPVTNEPATTYGGVISGEVMRQTNQPGNDVQCSMCGGRRDRPGTDESTQLCYRPKHDPGGSSGGVGEARGRCVSADGL